MNEPIPKPLVVGLKQSERAILEDRACCVFLAQDADTEIQDKIRRLCAKSGIPVVPAESCAELGHTCGIKVGAAVAAELRVE